MSLGLVQQVGPARWLATDRRGGFSAAPWDRLNLATHVGDDPTAVASNRARVADLLGVADLSVVQAEHSNVVQHVREPGQAAPGDVLVTTTAGLGLLVLAADCVPVVLVAPDISAIAVVHSGWRGVVANAVGAAVAALADLGAAPANLVARLGPSIAPSCYPVSLAVQEQVVAASGSAPAVTANGQPAVDVAAGVRAQLRQAGVRDIATDPRCTYCDPALFSYRRERTTGRQGMLVVVQ